MSLRITAYDVSNPSQRCKIMQSAVFRIKLHFTQRKSAIKFLCVKTLGSRVVRQSLASVTVHIWLVGDVPLNVNLCVK